MPSVLIVEDDAFVRECLYRGFIAEGWTVREVGEPGEALGWAQVQKLFPIRSVVARATALVAPAEPNDEAALS